MDAVGDDELLAPDAVAELSRALTGVVGLFVASLAYRGYRRNDAPRMRWLAVGIAALTAGVYAAVTVADWTGARLEPCYSSGVS